MQYRNLGRSGLKVSRLCLGTMNFGGPTDKAESTRILAKAKDTGVNFVDTADVYNGGQSEEITGALIKDARDAWVLATKIANPMADDVNGRGLSRNWIMRGIDRSLKRLGTDYVDIYYLHKEDHSTPLGETVNAIADLVRQGKIRYFGVSNYRSWRVGEICRLCDEFGIDRPIVSQPYYHALYRNAETEHLPACSHFGLGVVSYSPLARGVLTGKYAPDAAPDPQTRAGRNDKRMMQTEWHPDSLRTARKIKDYAEKRGTTAGVFAVAWVLHNALITGVVAGPRTEGQWDDYARALEFKWSAEDEALIDDLVVSGHPVVAGYNDPAYPLEGRPLA